MDVGRQICGFMCHGLVSTKCNYVLVKFLSLLVLLLCKTTIRALKNHKKLLLVQLS